MPKKNKILILGKLPPPYMGPAIATDILLNSELGNLYELSHLDTRINKSVSSMGKWGIKKVFKSMGVYSGLLKKLRKEKPDLVLIPVSQTTMGFFKDAIFILIASFFKTKILIQLRGSNFLNWYEGSGGMNRTFVKYVLDKTHGVIVLGEKLKYLFRPFFREEQIHVVPNGADYNLPQQKRETEELRVLYFANFLESKGFSDVLTAWKLMDKPRGRLVAAGAWDDEDYKKKCLKIMKGSKEQIELKGPQWAEDKWSLFAESGVFVFTPNAPEGHPWVIVEALAAGLPIISTDQGAITESVIDGVNGFIVPSNDPEAIAEKLRYLMSNDEMRKKMGKSSRLTYEQKFSEKQLVQNMDMVFKRVLNQ